MLDLYSNMIMFKCSYNECKNKNDKIVEFQKKVDYFISEIYDFEYDFVYKLHLINITETLVLNKYNDKDIKEISDKLELKNNKVINKAKGLNNQMEFIESYNNMLKKVRIYLENFTVKKYNIKYKFLKELDNKYNDIKSDSVKKIKYTN